MENSLDSQINFCIEIMIYGILLGNPVLCLLHKYTSQYYLINTHFLSIFNWRFTILFYLFFSIKLQFNVETSFFLLLSIFRIFKILGISRIQFFEMLMEILLFLIFFSLWISFLHKTYIALKYRIKTHLDRPMSSKQWMKLVVKWSLISFLFRYFCFCYQIT